MALHGSNLMFKFILETPQGCSKKVLTMLVRDMLGLGLVLVQGCYPGGVLKVYMTGGSEGASYSKPKKIHKPEILDPKKYQA